MDVDDSRIKLLNKIRREQAHVSGEHNQIDVCFIELLRNALLMFMASLFSRKGSVQGFDKNGNIVLFCILNTSSILFVRNTKDGFVDALGIVLMVQKCIHSRARARKEDCYTKWIVKRSDFL